MQLRSNPCCDTWRKETCSILSGWTGFAAPAAAPASVDVPKLAVSSADGRALQPYYLDGSIVLAYSACSILSGWTGFAAPELSWQQTRSADPCSILSGWTGFAACAMRSCAAWKVALAVSSADGRALQPFGMYQSPPIWTRLQYPQRMDGLCSACDHPIRASQ